MTLGDPEDRVRNLWSWLLQAFAEQTLRTLCLAYKDVEEDAYKEWEPEHQEAALLLQNRSQALHQVYNKMEQNLQVGGWDGMGTACWDPFSRALVPEPVLASLSCWGPRPLKTNCKLAFLRPSNASRRGTLKYGC